MCFGGIYVLGRDLCVSERIIHSVGIHVLRSNLRISEGCSFWRYLCSSEGFMYFGGSKEGVGSFD